MTRRLDVSNERLVRNAALPAKRHVSTGTTYREERIACSCGAVVRGEPDKIPDRHQPLIDNWNRHVGKRAS